MAAKVRRPAALKHNPTAASVAEATKRRRVMEFSESMLAQAHRKRAKSLDTPLAPNTTAFTIPRPPKGVLPPNAEPLAFDEVGMAQEFAAWAGAGYANYAFTEGLQFLGYPYLAELAQRAEYRRMVEVIATEMTRKWIKLKTRGDADKSKKIAKLEAELRRLQCREVFKRLAEQDGFFGRSHLYLDTGDTDNRDELMIPIGDGAASNEASASKVSKKRPVKALRPVEAVWTYPTNYNSNDPLASGWYRPDQWFVMGKQISASRLLTFIGREVPDLLKPAYSFGGLALTQMAKPYVTNWLQTRQSVNDAVSGFSTFVLITQMAAALQAGGDEQVLWRRAEFFDNFRNNRGLFMIDKDEEDFKNVSMPLGSLDKLQAQSQEHMSAVSGIPLVKLLGISPAGLNATSEGEIRVFYDWIAAYQNSLFGPNLQTVINFVQLSIFGSVDEDIEFEFEPLWAMDDKEIGEVEKAKADTDQVYVDMGAIGPDEVRARLASDPDSPYHGLDPEDMPDLLEEEEEGLEPEGGRPQPQVAEGEQAAGQTPPAQQHMPGAADLAMDDGTGHWEESKHKRGQPDNAGQFGSGGGGAAPAKPSGKFKNETSAKSGTSATSNSKGTTTVTGKGAATASGSNTTSAAKGDAGPAAALYQKAMPEPMSEAQRDAKAAQIAAKAGATEKIAKAREKLATVVSTDASVAQGGHVLPNGQWTPERRKIHDTILKGVFTPEAIKRALPAAGAKPSMTVLGGRGGSGKSWLTSHEGPVDTSKNVVIDADHFKGQLPEYEGWNAAQLHEESSYLVDRAADMAIQAGVNVVFDATLKSFKSAAARIAQFETAGHDIHGYYMFASPEVATERAMNRFVRGGAKGRFVPPEVIMGNTDNEKNFDAVIPICKRWAVYDNNGAAGPSRVAGENDERV